MIIKSGIDLVYLPRFRKSLKTGGITFLHRVYHEKELGNERIEHLAGIFALKEAVIKALSLEVHSWHSIFVGFKPNGAPDVSLLNVPFAIISSASSISHDGKYVIAQFVAIVKR